MEGRETYPPFFFACIPEGLFHYVNISTRRENE